MELELENFNGEREGGMEGEREGGGGGESVCAKQVMETCQWLAGACNQLIRVTIRGEMSIIIAWLNDYYRNNLSFLPNSTGCVPV